MKGILLAGGSGSRLYPMTELVSKHLLPVFDKPMVYYSLTTLMLANIRDILLITTPEAQPMYKKLLGDGKQFGIHIDYATQDQPKGIAEAILIGESFVDDDHFSLILGDNLFFGHGLAQRLQLAAKSRSGATILCYWVEDPGRYGIVEFDQSGKAIAIHEKPADAPSHYAITGMYFYDQRAFDYARELTPSERGELEISDINRRYLQQGNLNVELLGRGMAWLDTGTHESLLEASQFVELIEKRQGLKIACPEEVAWRMGYISNEQLTELANGIPAPGYRDYLLSLIKGGSFSINLTIQDDGINQKT